jgi:NAD(P)-dependent dehydrogenase (short-subunit alcohol dehydrogenase family)
VTYDGIAGKVAIVTGAGGGIGEAYARALAEQGARVAIAEIAKDKGEAVAASIRAGGGEALYVEVDVGSVESTLAMAERVTREWGGIDFLVNNAAIFGDMKMAGLLGADWDYYQKFMNVNMNGALLCTRACYRSMRKRGGGAIVNQSSTAAWMGASFYGLAKLGVNGLTFNLARELGSMKIRVNAIAPGPTDTEALGKQVPEVIRNPMVQSLPLARLGRPSDMANMCLFLLSDAASWVTGQIFAVDGGQIVRP